MSDKSAVYAAFIGLIDTETAERILHQLAPLTSPLRGIGAIHLLISSAGGEQANGVAIYNFMRSLRLELVAYNVGALASAGILAFLGASKRIGSVHAVFQIHRCTVKLDQGFQATDLHRLVEFAERQDATAEAIYKEAGIKFTDTQLTDLRSDKELLLSAEEALEIGLIHEIGEFSPPPDHVVLPI